MSDYKIELGDVSNISKDIKIIFITAEFNRELTKKLEESNENFLRNKGFNNIEKFLVPGAYEIPSFANKVIDKKNPDLIICFGVVVRGATTHYDVVAGESFRGIMNLSLSKDTSIINGVLTCENEDQVHERIGDNYAISGLKLLSERKKLDL